MDGRQSLLKQDARGRVRTPMERREALLGEFERSGLSGPKFAALVGVKYQTFAGWVHERGRKRPKAAASSGSSLRLVEAVVACQAKEAEGLVHGGVRLLQVYLAGGVRLQIEDAAQVPLAALLIRTLSREGAC